MLKIHAEPPQQTLAYSGPVLLALGFRPFFLAAGLSAVVLLALWIIMWSGRLPASGYYGLINWHSHEMLFGYGAAVMAGFLLTAVRNWTGVNTPIGLHLALLVLLWLGGRLVALMPEMVPDMAIAVIDLAFFPALALAIRPALWQGKQKVNRIFVPLLLLMALANLLVHLQALGVAQTAQRATDAMLYLTLLLITILAGRVMPFFTKAVLPDFEPKRWAWLEWISTLSMIGLIMLQLLYPQQTALSLLALVSAISLGLRVSGWHDLRIWHIPMLWILFLALLWIIIGLLLVALSHFAPALTNAATHALTIGGIGIMTLGMMSRVALGHTGRRLEPSRLTVLAFAVLNLGTVVRVFGPLVLPQSYFFMIHLSGGLWILAFLLFCVVYLPILLKPRIDGKPG
jgi:uncharacterized protein involved in response to NO